MRFTLVYRGDLPPNAGASHKARIRHELDPQLRRFWNDVWAEGMRYQDPDYQPNNVYVGRTVGELEYVPLISDRLSIQAELEITLLSAARPGGLLNHTGDIDNRLKTLLDALSVPTNQQAEAQLTFAPPDKRVFCLLDDDRLVVRLDISNDRLLSLEPGSRDAMAIIRVRPVAVKGTLANLSLTL